MKDDKDFLKLDPALAHIVPRKQHLRGEIPKGTPLQSDALLSEAGVSDDPLTTTVLCITCRQPLWKVKCRVDNKGRLLSTKTTLIVKEVDPNEPICPLCKGLYFDMRDNGTPKFLTSKGTM